ncbi:VirK family protein [Paraburkholderia hospita]|uniref:VirK family protein n=1 Tax=Paraburkholderia hospita TaxID=169430 RepID=UPI000B34317F|nr:VirK family protein [Paraburkholderia hospita]OUL77804.1 hypothetical protein CA603_35440 [Paraburkholderia hospita]
MKVATRFPIAVATIVAASLVAGISSAEAESPIHYERLRVLLLSGVPTTAIFTPARCNIDQRLASTARAAAASGGFVIRDFMDVTDDNIGFADEHLTVRPDGVPVLEFVQYRVMPADTAIVTVRPLSPVTYQPLSTPQVFRCALGEGLRFAYVSHDRD